MKVKEKILNLRMYVIRRKKERIIYACKRKKRESAYVMYNKIGGSEVAQVGTCGVIQVRVTLRVLLVKLVLCVC
jgi:hypothetical protein